MTDREAFVALNLIPKLGPVRVRALLERFGGPQAVLRAPRRELQSVKGVGEEVAASIAGWEASIDLEGELKAAEEAGARILTIADEEYPALLREIHDPPTVLYVLGGFLPRDRVTVAVIGTRKPSLYGANCAKQLAFQLAYAGVTVASGLARGVDTAAHQAALAAQGRTVAVVGSGLGELYPPENRELAEKIAGAGAVVSEFPMGAKADRQTFPMRNRIVSGLSSAVLVIEAGERSGALITAAQAAEQNRSLYAVPGRIDTPAAAGCNRLIQQGAKLVTDARDILDDFGLLFAGPVALEKPAPPPELGELERAVYEALGDGEPSLDEVLARCGLPTRQVSSTLLALEIRKLVRQLPGGRFTKLL